MASAYPGALITGPSQATLAGYHGNTGPMSKLLGDLYDNDTALSARLGITGSSDANSLDYQIRHVETTYTPVLSTGNGSLTSPSTVTGSFHRATNAKKGDISIRVVATGTWSGSGAPWVRLTLPAGWTGASSRECANVIGFAAPISNPLGVHYPLFGVVHAGDTYMRMITRDGSNPWQAFEGVNFPFGFVSGDYFDLVGTVRLA